MRRFLTIFAIFMASHLVAQQAYASDTFLGIPRFKGVNPVKDMNYQESCGECHFAYFPGLLPSRSWKKIMAPKALENHFGENAELDESDRQAILSWLLANAAETSHYKRSVKIVLSLRDDQAPLRITKTPYIQRKHEEVSEMLNRRADVMRKVRSLSNCAKCHQEASKGVFDDDTVRIPVYGEWDD